MPAGSSHFGRPPLSPLGPAVGGWRTPVGALSMPTAVGFGGGRAGVGGGLAARDAQRLGGRRTSLGGGHGGAAEVAGGLVAVLGALGHRPGDDVVELRRDVRHQLAGARRLLLRVGPELRDGLVAREGHLTGQEVEEDAAERVDVGAGVDGLALELLGRDVVGGADPLTRRRHLPAAGHVLDEAEVGQVGVLVGHHHVGRLDVAVDEPALVGGVEGVAELGDDPRRAARLEPARGLQLAAEVGPLDEAHRDEQLAVGVAGLVDRDDVRVLDRRGQARLGLEAAPELGIASEVGRDQLERDATVECGLCRRIDHAHSTLSDEMVDFVSGDVRPPGEHRDGG